jgi:hypothetical protein
LPGLSLAKTVTLAAEFEDMAITADRKQKQIKIN